jgi:hypothetical protein
MFAASWTLGLIPLFLDMIGLPNAKISQRALVFCSSAQILYRRLCVCYSFITSSPYNLACHFLVAVLCLSYHLCLSWLVTPPIPCCYFALLSSSVFSCYLLCVMPAFVHHYKQTKKLWALFTESLPYLSLRTQLSLPLPVFTHTVITTLTCLYAHSYYTTFVNNTTVVTLFIGHCTLLPFAKSYWYLCSVLSILCTWQYKVLTATHCHQIDTVVTAQLD